MKIILNIYTFSLLIGMASCGVLQENTKDDITPKTSEEVEFSEEITKTTHPGYKARVDTLTGWWVYGEGQHIFKDEATLLEMDIVFENENIKEMEELYLAVCEMEYFPMECKMIGYPFHYSNGRDNPAVFTVLDFEILYIQGCGE